MPDLKDALRRGADVTTGLPDMPEIWSRAVRVRRRRRVVATAGAAAVLGVVATLGVALDGPPAPPETVAAPRPPAALELPAYPGPLSAGATYDVGEPRLPYGFTVPGPGWNLAAREPGWMSLHATGVRLNLQQWDAVLDPSREEVDQTAFEPVPPDLIGWLTRHPRLDVLSRRTTALADERWRVLEVRVTDPLATSPPECGVARCVVLGQVGAEPVELLASERALIYVHPDGADQTVLLIAAFPASSPGLPPAAFRLLESIHERPVP